ncbi:MAG: hypothetical protein ABIH41_05420 [Nanoarchaeota archaeon]
MVDAKDIAAKKIVRTLGRIDDYFSDPNLAKDRKKLDNDLAKDQRKLIKEQYKESKDMYNQHKDNEDLSITQRKALLENLQSKKDAFHANRWHRRMGDAFAERTGAKGAPRGEVPFWILTILFHIFVEWRSGFNRTSASFVTVTSFFYIIVFPLIAAWVYNDGGRLISRYLRALPFGLIAFALPYAQSAVRSMAAVDMLSIGSFDLVRAFAFFLTWFPVWSFFFFYFRGQGLPKKALYILLVFYFFAAVITYWALIPQLAGNIVPGGTAIDTGGTLTQWRDMFIYAPIERIIGVFGGIKNANITGTVSKFTDPYLTARVEDTKDDVELGVHIENLEPLFNPVTSDDEEIIVDAVISGKSFVGQFDVHNSCWAKYKQGLKDGKMPGQAVLVGKVDLPDFSISDFEEQSVECTILNGDMGNETESVEVGFNASFAYSTWGYVDMYFMDQTELRDRRREGQDVAGVFKIPREAEAVYTNGPIVLGLVDSQNPPQFPLSLDSDYKGAQVSLNLFGVTLENAKAYANRGSIESITDVKFHLPAFVTIVPDSCNPGGLAVSGPSLDEGEQYHTYTITGWQVRPDQPFQTMRCRLQIEKGEIPSFLGPVKLAAATFAAEVNYHYQLTKSTRVKRVVADG